MQFQAPLVEARLIRRYKRFLADVRLADGQELTVHCPNPGAMLGVAVPGGRVWLSPAKPSAKLPFGWELAEVDGGLIGINTNRPNQLVKDALGAGAILPLAGDAPYQPEVRYGNHSRIDFLGGTETRRCFVEVKNVHLMRTQGLAEFPDCVTARGAKHLVDLSHEVGRGHRAVMVFIIQRMDCDRLALAGDLDSIYMREFNRALQLGVEAYAYSCMITPDAIRLDRPIPIQL
jgi:sugar fermentation stimulation protein A